MLKSLENPKNTLLCSVQDQFCQIPLPSRESFRDFLQFYQLPYHVLLGSLKGSCRTFPQQVASDYQIVLLLPYLFHKRCHFSCKM